MATVASMKASARVDKPLVPATVVIDEKYINVRIPRTVGASDVREKSDDKGTRHGMTCIPTNDKGLALGDVEINVMEDGKPTVGKFALGVFNLQFHGFKA